MYNGIGLPTPRGSGTSGYIQKNLSHLKPRRSDISVTKQGAVGEGWGKSTQLPKLRKPNAELLEHERRRQVEIKLLRFVDELRVKQIAEEVIQDRVTEERQRLLALSEETRTNGSEISAFNIDTHQASQLKKEELARIREALNIPHDYDSDNAVTSNVEKKEKETDLHSKEEKGHNQKKYSRGRLTISEKHSGHRESSNSREANQTSLLHVKIDDLRCPSSRKNYNMKSSFLNNSISAKDKHNTPITDDNHSPSSHRSFSHHTTRRGLHEKAQKRTLKSHIRKSSLSRSPSPQIRKSFFQKNSSNRRRMEAGKEYDHSIPTLHKVYSSSVKRFNTLQPSTLNGENRNSASSLVQKNHCHIPNPCVHKEHLNSVSLTDGQPPAPDSGTEQTCSVSHPSPSRETSLSGFSQQAEQPLRDVGFPLKRSTSFKKLSSSRSLSHRTPSLSHSSRGRKLQRSQSLQNKKSSIPRSLRRKKSPLSRRRRSLSRSLQRRRYSQSHSLSRPLPRRRYSQSHSLSRPLPRRRPSLSHSLPQRQSSLLRSLPRRKSSFSRSLPRKKASCSHSLPRRKSSFSRSSPRRKSSFSRSLPRRKSSFSRSLPRRKSSFSRSLPRRKSSFSRSLPRRKSSFSRSLVQRESSLSRSLLRRTSSFSRSPPRKRQSQSRSLLRKRLSFSRSLPRKRPSLLRSLPRGRLYSSHSLSSKTPSLSRSMPRIRPSLYRSSLRKKLSLSHSLSSKRPFTSKKRFASRSLSHDKRYSSRQMARRQRSLSTYSPRRSSRYSHFTNKKRRAVSRSTASPDKFSYKLSLGRHAKSSRSHKSYLRLSHSPSSERYAYYRGNNHKCSSYTQPESRTPESQKCSKISHKKSLVSVSACRKLSNSSISSKQSEISGPQSILSGEKNRIKNRTKLVSTSLPFRSQKSRKIDAPTKQDSSTDAL